jgi:hypothetical protein
MIAVTVLQAIEFWLATIANRRGAIATTKIAFGFEEEIE